MQTNTIIFLWRLVNYEKQFSTRIQPSYDQRYDTQNRVVMMPMGSDFAGHDGKLSDEHIKYYELRARGGTGLLYVRDVSLTERMPDAIWY